MNLWASTRKPRVAIVVSHPIQHFCPQYASLAASEHWDLHVFFASSAGKGAYVDKGFGRKLSWSKLALDRFPHSFLNTNAIPSTAALDAPNLEAELGKYEPDVVIIYGYWQKLQRRAKRYALETGRKLYFISDTELNGTRSPLLRAARVAYARRMIAGVSRFLTVGNGNEFFYARCGVRPDQMTRMSFPIDVATYEPVVASRDCMRQLARQERGLAEHEVVFGNVGKFLTIKRQEDLIQAASMIDSALPVRVLLAGSGPCEHKLRAMAAQLAPSRVTFVGFVAPDLLPSFYASCDAYAHVSSFEPHSLAISEAIYIGLPIIVSHACGSYGPHDDVRPGVNGMVYPTGSVEKLAEVMETMARSPVMRSALGTASERFAREAQHLAHNEFLRQALSADGLLPPSQTCHA